MDVVTGAAEEFVLAVAHEGADDVGRASDARRFPSGHGTRESGVAGGDSGAGVYRRVLSEEGVHGGNDDGPLADGRGDPFY